MRKILIGVFSFVLVISLIYVSVTTITNNERAKASGDVPIGQKEDSTIKNVKSREFDMKAETNKALKKVNSAKGIISEKTSSVPAIFKNDDKSKEEELNKWVLRVLIDAKYFENEDMSVGTALSQAIKRIKFEEAWLELAETKYGITYSDEEVDEFIRKGPDSNPTNEQIEYAESLGLTLEQLNHEYDRLFYVKQIVWTKLAPIIQEKYGLKEFEDPQKEQEDPLHNRIIRQYESEIQELLKK